MTIEDLERIQFKVRVAGMENAIDKIKEDYFGGWLSRSDAASALRLCLGFRTVEAIEEINSWEGVNGNDNGCA